jgi:hypothetical protein
LLELVILTNFGRLIRERPINYTTSADVCQEKFFRQNAQKNDSPSTEGNHYVSCHTGINGDFVGELEILKAVIPHKSETFHFSECGAGQILDVIANILLVFLGGLAFCHIQKLDFGILLIVFTAESSTDAIFSRADFEITHSALLE